MREVAVEGRVVAIDGCGDEVQVTIGIERGELAGGRLKLRPDDHQGDDGLPVFTLGATWTGTVTVADGP